MTIQENINKLEKEEMTLEADVHFVAVHTPNNQHNQPSMEFSALGYMNENEVRELESTLYGYLSRVVLFDDEQDYDKQMGEMDQEYFV